MARHGENIRKRKDGRWEGRYGIYSVEKEKKIYRSVYGRSYEEAKARLMAVKGQSQGEVRKKSVPVAGKIQDMERAPGECTAPEHGGTLGQNSPPERELSPEYERISGDWGTSKIRMPENRTLTELAQEWLAKVKETRKPSTYVKYRMIVQQHIESAFIHMELCQITDGLVRKQISDTLSDSVQKSIYCVLNQILKYASRQYGLTLPMLMRTGSSGPRKIARPFSGNEQKKLFAVLTSRQDLFKIAMLLCLYTGMRLGEVCALRWEDVDLAGRIITVSRTVQRLYMEGFQTKTVLWESEPKSEHSRREIPLSDAVLELLVRLRGPDEGTYIFGGEKPVEPRTMQNHFKKILRETGLEERSFHTLRHTFATNCIEGGTDVKSLSELLGHSDVQITLNRYVHPSMDSKRKYLDVLSAFYDRICGQIWGQAG